MARQALVALYVVACTLSAVLGVEYQDRGAGPCTVDGIEPSTVVVPAAGREACQSRCDQLGSCHGYMTEGGQCLLYTAGPLAGSKNPGTNASHCFEKRTPPSPLPPIDDSGVRYMEAGRGLCYFNGHAPVGQFLASVDAEACEQRCSGSAACWGYSQDPTSGACSIFEQGPLSGGGPAWGDAYCVVKAPRAMLRSSAKPQMVRNALRDVFTETQYEVDGTGACTRGGIAPFNKVVAGASPEECKQACTAGPSCYGFESTESGDCRILTQGPLAGGCSRKVQTPAPSADTLYKDTGRGVCQWRSSAQGQARLLPGLSASECAVRCTLVSTCTGFSSQTDSCLLFTGAPLNGGGDPWGFAHCHLKVSALVDDDVELLP